MKITFSFTRKSGISFKKSKLYEKKWNFPWKHKKYFENLKKIHFFTQKSFKKVFTFSIKNHNLFYNKFSFFHKKKWNSIQKSENHMRKSGNLHIILTIILENLVKIHCFHKKSWNFSIQNQNDFHLKKNHLCSQVKVEFHWKNVEFSRGKVESSRKYVKCHEKFGTFPQKSNVFLKYDRFFIHVFHRRKVSLLKILSKKSYPLHVLPKPKYTFSFWYSKIFFFQRKKKITPPQIKTYSQTTCPENLITLHFTIDRKSDFFLQTSIKTSRQIQVPRNIFPPKNDI